MLIAAHDGFSVFIFPILPCFHELLSIANFEDGSSGCFPLLVSGFWKQGKARNPPGPLGALIRRLSRIADRGSRSRMHHCFTLNSMKLSYNIANISTIGKPPEHIPIGQARLYISPATRGGVKPHHSSPDHIIGDQALGVHHLGVLEAEGANSGLPK